MIEQVFGEIMRPLKPISGSDDDRARARLLAFFEDYPDSVFYSRQLEVIFEGEYFHWVINRAVRRLADEGRILRETRQLSIGSNVTLYWHKKFRFYKRAASNVFSLVDRYSRGASDGALGLQGEHLVLAAFARRRFVLSAEAANTFGDKKWTETKHDMDFIFERDGRAFGVEVKNTLGYMDLNEFCTKVMLCVELGITPIFAVRALPKTWASILINSGGYAMIMRFQFYPWTHAEIAREIRDALMLPVDTPRKIEDGTMDRFEGWLSKPGRPADIGRVGQRLAELQAAFQKGQRHSGEDV